MPCVAWALQEVQEIFEQEDFSCRDRLSSADYIARYSSRPLDSEVYAHVDMKLFDVEQ